MLFCMSVKPGLSH